MISDYDEGGLRTPSIDIMAKSMKLAWIPRLLLEEENFEDSWKVIPNYLLDKFEGLNFLLRCNYDKKFLARINLPQFYAEILQNFLELKTSYNVFFPIKNLFCLITRIYCWTDALSSTKLGLTKVYISSKIFWTQMVKLCRTQNLKRNIF